MIKLGQYRLFRRTEPAGKPPVFCSSEKYAKKERKVLTGRGCSGIINLVLRRKAKDKTEKYAAVAHLVERHLAKVEVASSSLVSRSTFPKNLICGCSSSGRAPPCQGGGSEFEPRQPLQSVHLRKRVDFFVFHRWVYAVFLCGNGAPARGQKDRQPTVFYPLGTPTFPYKPTSVVITSVRYK